MPDPDSPETELSEPNRHPLSKEAVQLLRDDRETIVLKVKADRKGFLILADKFYAGWEARVDGQATPILVANGFTRAVLVPQGEHVVEFAYRPKSLMLGICLALLGCFLSIYLWFVARREQSDSP
ncbi:MAG: YfhO family protein [Candidatus Obscuribacterales bacterium]|nr:YfhO family protein [Candidatus Obscuribacterales bacterium]